MSKVLISSIKEAVGVPRRFGDIVFKQLTMVCAVFVLLLIVAMGWQLTQSAMPAVKLFGFDFLSAKSWDPVMGDRKSTRLNSSHVRISYAVFCLKKKTQ